MACNAAGPVWRECWARASAMSVSASTWTCLEHQDFNQRKQLGFGKFIKICHLKSCKKCLYNSHWFCEIFGNKFTISWDLNPSVTKFMNCEYRNSWDLNPSVTKFMNCEYRNKLYKKKFYLCSIIIVSIFLIKWSLFYCPV